MNAQIKPKLLIAREGYSEELIEESKPLLHEHWLEIAGYKDEIPLDPDYPFYKRMEDQGKLLWLTARIGGELIGYSVFFIVRHAHYKSTIFANNDVLFVRKDRRLGRTGLSLIIESERQSKTLGARKINWHVKAITPDLRRLLEHRGYVVDESSMGKLL